MRVLNRDRIQAFIKKHPDSGPSLRAWSQIVESNEFKHFIDIRDKIRSADYVKPHTIFNIAGNKYRLISLISYLLKTVSIEAILTHKEYDKGKWRKR